MMGILRLETNTTSLTSSHTIIMTIIRLQKESVWWDSFESGGTAAMKETSET